MPCALNLAESSAKRLLTDMISAKVAKNTLFISLKFYRPILFVLREGDEPPDGVDGLDMDGAEVDEGLEYD